MIAFFAMTFFLYIIYLVDSNPIFTIVLLFVIKFLYALLFGGKYLAKLFSTIIIVVAINVSESITLYSILIITNISYQEAVNDGPYRLAGILISKIIALILIRLICIKINFRYVYVERRYWFLLLSTPLASIAIVFTLSIQCATGSYTLRSLCVLTSIFILYIDIVIFYLFDKIVDDLNSKIQNKLLKQQIRNQISLYQYNEISNQKTRRLHHDMKNHLQCIIELLHTDRVNDAINYINSVYDVLNAITATINTGNVVLDSILNAKLQIINEKNIKLDYTIEIPAKLNIDPVDLCILLGNSLDNAIEACEKVHSNKEISIILTYRNKSLIYCISNTSNNTSIEKHGFVLSSESNTNDHGIGLLNIKSVVEKYNGAININNGIRWFELTAILYV
jgi:Signal transduction histidine kinase regulating citrate/malate metabolism